MTAIITSRAGGTHSLPTEWLGKRMLGWMFLESQGSPWWLCAVTREGSFKLASHDGSQQGPSVEHEDYAKRVAWHLNQVADHGGAWFTAWIDGVRFYLLWKDSDGDIQIPIECDLGWHHIADWTPDDWAEQAEQAHAAWTEFYRNIAEQAGPLKTVNLAQGQLQ